MTPTEKLVAFAVGGGALGAIVLGTPLAILGGALLGGLAKVALGRAGGAAAFQGDPPSGVSTIEAARFAKNDLKRQLFSLPDVPWWLIGVGIGGTAPNYYVLVSVSDTPPEVHATVPQFIQGVPVVVDATGAQPLEMSTGL